MCQRNLDQFCVREREILILILHKMQEVVVKLLKVHSIKN